MDWQIRVHPMNTLMLYFEAFVSNLEPIHLLNSRFGRYDGIIRDKTWSTRQMDWSAPSSTTCFIFMHFVRTKAFAFTGILVHINLGTDDISKRVKSSC